MLPRTMHEELSQPRNIGKAMRRGFELLGMRTVRQLARCSRAAHKPIPAG